MMVIRSSIGGVAEKSSKLDLELAFWLLSRIPFLCQLSYQNVDCRLSRLNGSKVLNRTMSVRLHLSNYIFATVILCVREYFALFRCEDLHDITTNLPRIHVRTGSNSFACYRNCIGNADRPSHEDGCCAEVLWFLLLRLQPAEVIFHPMH
jgi:hypothetical protein